MMAGMEPLHISEAETIRDIAAILERVERGAEVIVEKDRRPAVVMRPALRPGRLLSECIARAESRGSTATLDEGFSKDLEEIIDSRRESLDASRWD
jgi:antitoxin (DNA-binding transcriptional repressor) of toxin-antitoxin stability system